MTGNPRLNEIPKQSHAYGPDLLTGSDADSVGASFATDPVIAVDSGMLQGSRSGALLVFKGIPYAAPPVGDLRWRPPAPVATWSGVRPALEFGNDCEQTRRPWDTGRADAPMGEDSLTLNVWAPEGASDEGWPVMFWIHGGSYTAGSSAQPVYDGSRLAARGVVVVTINYRLGRFGFFAHPALTREAGSTPVGNFGIMDQIAALEWVRRNIHAFGGDPNNVTIFGESAGGGSVNRLMIARSARGLFRQAIAQSGGGRERAKTLAEAEAIGKAFAEQAGVAGDDATALRALPVEVVRGGDRLELDTAIFSGVMIDGRILEEDVDVAFEGGRQAPVPYIAGANSDEISVITPALRPIYTAAFTSQVDHGHLEAIKAAYTSSETFEARVMGDATFVEPARHLARAAARNGSYLYTFDYVAEAERTAYSGAPHAYEVPFVFGNLDALTVRATAEDRRMSDIMMQYWTAFAKSGRPAAPELEVWPASKAGGGEMLVFSANGLVVRRTESCALDALAKFAAFTARERTIEPDSASAS